MKQWVNFLLPGLESKLMVVWGRNVVDCVAAVTVAAVAVFRADLRRRSMKMRRKMARRMVMEMIEVKMMRNELELSMLEFWWLW